MAMAGIQLITANSKTARRAHIVYGQASWCWWYACFIHNIYIFRETENSSHNNNKNRCSTVKQVVAVCLSLETILLGEAYTITTTSTYKSESTQHMISPLNRHTLCGKIK